MTIQKLTPEEYNKFSLGEAGNMRHKMHVVDENIEDLTYIYIYNMLRLNEAFISITLAAKSVSELVAKAKHAEES